MYHTDCVGLAIVSGSNCYPLRHSFCTRLLHTIMPSSLYAAKDKTIDRLHENMTEDLTKLYNEGIEIEATPQHLS